MTYQTSNYRKQGGDTWVVDGQMQFGSTASAAILHGAGTSAAPDETSTANLNFMGYWTKTTATSGDSRGLYLRHYLGGVTGGAGYGDAVRAFCTVTGTGYAYASGIHATMQINASATVTGSGAGVRATLAAAADTRTLGGKLAAAQIDSDVAAGNTLPTVHGFLRFVDNGAVRLSNLAVIPVASNGTVFATHTTQVMSHSIRIVDEAGTPYYIMVASVLGDRGA
jgi:hypothetical protein